MNVGELFLNLGVKGTKATVDSIMGVKKGLSETASMSLEAKAGILAAMYALERLFSASGRVGTGLTNFNALTGESVKQIQQYQYAARQMGISNDEVTGSFKTLQDAMTDVQLGKGAPSGLARVSQLTGGNLTREDIDKYAKEPALLIQRLQEYASKETNVGLRNATLKSFGLSEGMVAALSRQAFRPDVLKRAPVYTDREVSQLDRANIAWSNLGNKIHMAIGHFNAMHGLSLVSDISKIVDQVVRLSDAFIKLADKLKVFQGIDKIFQGWILIFNELNAIVDIASKFSVKDLTLNKGKELLKGSVENGPIGMLSKVLMEKTALAMSGTREIPAGKNTPAAPVIHKLLGNAPIQSIAPPMPVSQSSTSHTQNNTVKIENHFQHPGTDHRRTSNDMKNAVHRAYRQMSAQTQHS